MGELSKLHVMFNQLKLHIREGIIVKWYLFLTVMLVSFSLSMVYIFIGNSAIERYSDTQQLTFLNVVAYIFRGMQEYNPAEGKEFIIEDENFFLIKRLNCSAISSSVCQCVTEELSVLQKLADLTAAQLKSSIDYNGFLPQWDNEPVDLHSEYSQMLDSLSTKGYGMFAKYRAFKVKNGKLTPLMAGFILKVVQVVIWVFTALIILQIWGINLTPVIAGLGVTGVVLGFALQESISNIFSGLLLALNNPFGIGDYVLLGSIEGTVTGMDAISVTLLSGDNKKITISNKIVLADAIINYSASDIRRVDMAVSVAYGSDLEKAKDIITNLVKSYPEVLSDKPVIVEVGALSASSIDFIIRPWSKNSDYWTVKWRFQKEICPALNAAGIEVPYNKLDVNILTQN